MDAPSGAGGRAVNAAEKCQWPVLLLLLWREHREHLGPILTLLIIYRDPPLVARPYRQCQRTYLGGERHAEWCAMRQASRTPDLEFKSDLNWLLAKFGLHHDGMAVPVQELGDHTNGVIRLGPINVEQNDDCVRRDRRAVKICETKPEGINLAVDSLSRVGNQHSRFHVLAVIRTGRGLAGATVTVVASDATPVASPAICAGTVELVITAFACTPAL